MTILELSLRLPDNIAKEAELAGLLTSASIERLLCEELRRRTVKVAAVPQDPIRALHGRGQGENLLDRLLGERRADAERDE